MYIQACSCILICGWPQRWRQRTVQTAAAVWATKRTLQACTMTGCVVTSCACACLTLQEQGLHYVFPSQMLLLRNQACFWHKGLQQEVRFTSVPNLQLHQLAGWLTAAQSWARVIRQHPKLDGIGSNLRPQQWGFVRAKR